MERDIKIDNKVNGIVKKVSLYMRNLNFEYIKNEIYKAYIFAYEAHKGQKRLS
ncbi:MAG: hypothetical protein LBD88_00980 [Candidatus Peribacteria bacterium]|jgi:hypothetical protein|nr:hypothetical protein [Candidatus Peribacteria bacterium]